MIHLAGHQKCQDRRRRRHKVSRRGGAHRLRSHSGIPKRWWIPRGLQRLRNGG